MQIFSAPDLVSSTLFPCFLVTHTHSRIEQMTVLWNASEEVARRDIIRRASTFHSPCDSCWWSPIFLDSLDRRYRQNHAVSKWAEMANFVGIPVQLQASQWHSASCQFMSGSEWRCSHCVLWSHHVVALFARGVLQISSVQKLIWKFWTFNWRGWKSLYCLNRNQCRKTVFKTKCFRIQAGRLQPHLKRLRWVWVCWFLLILHNGAT